jgi:phosphoribosylglycinamide formyltransferase 1
MLPIGVLASGNGSNFEALARALRQQPVVAEVRVLLCNVPDALVLRRAANLGIQSLTIPHQSFPSREAYDQTLVEHLKSHGVQLVVLAGYMRLLTPVLLQAFPGAVINIHPSLLPSFKGLHAIRQALDAKVAATGCTVHFVDEGMDTGAIIAQREVKVEPDDTEAALAARVMAAEHALLPQVVRDIATGAVRCEHGRVIHTVAPESP